MYRVGVDLGGTNTKIGIIDEKSRIFKQVSFPTQAKSPAKMVVKDIALTILKMLDEENINIKNVKGIGIGSPGAVEEKTGKVIYSNNFDWYDIPLTEMVYEYISLPVKAVNDAQCALLGEVEAGAARGCSNIIMVTLGTGVGGGILVNGKLFTGGTGGTVIGHMVLYKNGERCSCGRLGCLEAYASASALVRETLKMIKRHPDSMAGKIHARQKSINGKTVFYAAEQGDQWAQVIIRKYIEDLGDGIANLVDIFRPEKVLISGGISNQGDNLLVPLERYVHKQCFAGNKLLLPKVERAALGNMAGMIGAASLVNGDYI